MAGLRELAAEIAADAAGADHCDLHVTPHMSITVVPAKAGTQCRSTTLDSRLRGNDGLVAIA